MSRTDSAGSASAAPVAVALPAGGPHGLRGAVARWALVPLRLFLGVTFCYAGIHKLADPAFLSASGPGSLGELLRGVHDTAGAGVLVDLALRSPVGFGYTIALGELAVGLGTLFGLWSRIAAFGGALLSLLFWLTVSWPTSPYYLGNDLAYLMAWTPLLLAGSPRLSLDALLAQRRRHRDHRIFG